jgi:hypothetical protein
MKKEKEAHEALSMIFHRDGVPNVMVMYGAKAQVQGEFRRKLRDSVCHIRQTEPHTQSSNMGEGGVRELNPGVGRQMLRSGFPKRLWDDYLVIEAYVRSNTVLDIFGLEGQLPESRVKGETVDISTIAEYGDSAASSPVSSLQDTIGKGFGCCNRHWSYHVDKFYTGPPSGPSYLMRCSLRLKLRGA